MTDAILNKKRKRAVNVNPNIASTRVSELHPEYDEAADILLLETNILESRKNYNDITKLIEQLRSNVDESPSLAAVALCRVFCRLLAAGVLTNNHEPSDNSSQAGRTIAQWLLERLKETYAQLFRILKENNSTNQATILTVSMQLLKEQAKHYHRSNLTEWSRNAFQDMIETLMTDDTPFTAVEGFVDLFASKYDDIRYHTFDRVTYAVLPPRHLLAIATDPP